MAESKSKTIPRLRRGDAALLVVDVQEKFRPVLYEFERMVRNCLLLIKGAKVFGLPILVTEQYPQGLGTTVKELSEALGDFQPVSKNCFSAFGVEEFRRRLWELNVSSLLICGLESHVCVLQTVMDAVEAGYSVFLAQDAISSRTRFNWEATLQRARTVGAILVTTEMALFELLETADAGEFKAIQALVKELSPAEPEEEGLQRLRA